MYNKALQATHKGKYIYIFLFKWTEREASLLMDCKIYLIVSRKKHGKASRKALKRKTATVAIFWWSGWILDRTPSKPWPFAFPFLSIHLPMIYNKDASLSNPKKKNSIYLCGVFFPLLNSDYIRSSGCLGGICIQFLISIGTYLA